jgi:Flp pilus assembly pilin Flp
MKNNLKKVLVNLWKDESAQGITEYILLLVIVVAIVTLFKKQIQDVIRTKVGDLSGQISGVTPN